MRKKKMVLRQVRYYSQNLVLPENKILSVFYFVEMEFSGRCIITG